MSELDLLYRVKTLRAMIVDALNHDDAPDSSAMTDKHLEPMLEECDSIIAQWEAANDRAAEAAHKDSNFPP